MKNSYAVVLCLSSELNERVRSGVYPEGLDIEIDDTRALDRLQTIDLFPKESRDEGIRRLIEALRASPYHPNH